LREKALSHKSTADPGLEGDFSLRIIVVDMTIFVTMRSSDINFVTLPD
jgi:hypothetical protein